jgi:hypothetical protein
LSDRGLFNKHISAIVDALNNKPKIKRVDLSINNLDDECLADLRRLKHVNFLNLSRNNFSDIKYISKEKNTNAVVKFFSPKSFSPIKVHITHPTNANSR